MKHLFCTLTAFLLAAEGFAAKAYEYTCYPSRKNPDRSAYTLIVKGKTIQLGYQGSELKAGKQEENLNQGELADFVKYGGRIDDLRGEGYLDAYLAPELLEGGNPLSNGTGGQMILAWGSWGSPLLSSYLCISQD